MPLSKLLQRRNSSQKEKKKSLTSEELSTPESNVEETISVKVDQTQTAMCSESIQVEEKFESICELKDNEEIEGSGTQQQTEDINTDTCNSMIQSKMHKRYSVPEVRDINEQVQNKPRSLSLKESGTKLLVQRTRRRKCESESSAFSSTDDEGFEDKVIQLRERDLEKVIGQCVDRLIRESILTAVKSVKVDSICEDVMKSLSRSASESSESSAVLETVQQKLHSGSVTEYADLQMVHTFEESRLEEDVELEESEDTIQQEGSDPSVAVSDASQSNILSEDDQVDSEASLNLTESELTSEDKLKESKQSLEFDNCLNSVIDPKVVMNESINYEEHNESSTCTDKNEKTSTDVQKCGPNNLDTSSELDKDSIENKEIQESVAFEQETEVRESQQNSISNKSLEDGTQSDYGEDIVDCARPVKDHEFQNEVKKVKDELIGEHGNSKTDIEDMKDVSVDGYHADIEESISLHSMASESSFENVKDSNDCSRSISGDTVASTEEAGELGAVVNKETAESSKPELDAEKVRKNLKVEVNLMAMSGDDFSQLLTANETTIEEPETDATDLGENLPEQKSTEDEKKVNWKVGYLHVKLPHKSRHKGLKVWKKRCVAIQPDEFSSDDSEPCLVLSVYSGDSSAAKKHSASFWKSISCQKAVIYRSSSRTHPYSFTISDDKKPVIHLSADSEAISQEWMAAIRAILWPPSPVVQLEKMLNGREFEISIIDNEFSYHAGLLGMYGYLTITTKKLILVHPQQGYVIQEWYLNTVDKFQLIPQTRIEDVNKVLSMTTCSDSSTGKGDILIFCKEAVSLLQSVASTIHQILTHHSVQEGGKYQKELEEIGAWLVADSETPEDYYKVPPRQVKSLLDIPNFIFNKPITPIATVAGTPGVPEDSPGFPKIPDPTRASQDSGISSETVSDDFLNCSTTSFKVGGGPFPGKSSDSELSDAYTPPRSPVEKPRRGAEASEAMTKT